MSKKFPLKGVKLTDQQVRIMAQASRMGLFEFLVRLSTISAVVKVSHYAISSVRKPRSTPVHLTQNIYGEPDAAVVAADLRTEIKKLGATEDVSWSEETDKVENPGQYDTPDVGFDIPTQPTATPGEE